MTKIVQIANDKEIGAYQVFLMSPEGCQESETFFYWQTIEEGKEARKFAELNKTPMMAAQGDAFAQAQKLARDWAAEHNAPLETMW